MLRDVEIDPAWVEAGAYLGPEPLDRLITHRANAREADRGVQSRLLSDLKGVSFPVRVMVDNPGNMRPGELTVPRAIPAWVDQKKDLVDLGGGLFVLTPEATVVSLGSCCTIIEVAKVIFEACGIFTLVPQTSRIRLVVEDLVRQGVLTREAFKPFGVFGYSDERGRALGDYDRHGNLHEWTPSFNRFNRITDLWKRPALTCVEEIESVLDRCGRTGGFKTVRRALDNSLNGAASPDEVRAIMLLCSDTWLGGESWARPDLNRMIRYSTEAANLAGSSHCFADALWPGHKGVLEVLGEAFHADDLGFRPQSERTAALESMGYSVAELIHEQMANLEFFDTVLPALASKLGFEPHKKTVAFLRRREELHQELFKRPYDPMV